MLDVTFAPGNSEVVDNELSIAIPCFNEADTIGGVIDQLAASFPRAELLVVDDGSSDDTAQRAGGRLQVRLLRHAQNRGYGASIRTACLAASRPYIVWFDADGQHGAEMVTALLTRLPAADCVLGARSGRGPVPWARRWGVAAICWLARILLLRHIPDLNCGLRAFRLDVLRRYLPLLPDGFSASATTTLVMLQCGHRVAWAPIPRLARSGSSRLRPLRDGGRTVLLVVRLALLLSPWTAFLSLATGLGLLGLLAGIGGWTLGGPFLLLPGGLAAGAGLALLLVILGGRRGRRWREGIEP